MLPVAGRRKDRDRDSVSTTSTAAFGNSAKPCCTAGPLLPHDSRSFHRLLTSWAGRFKGVLRADQAVPLQQALPGLATSPAAIAPRQLAWPAGPAADLTDPAGSSSTVPAEISHPTVAAARLPNNTSSASCVALHANQQIAVLQSQDYTKVLESSAIGAATRPVLHSRLAAGGVGLAISEIHPTEDDSSNAAKSTSAAADASEAEAEEVPMGLEASLAPEQPQQQQTENATAFTANARDSQAILPGSNPAAAAGHAPELSMLALQQQNTSTQQHQLTPGSVSCYNHTAEYDPWTADDTSSYTSSDSSAMLAAAAAIIGCSRLTPSPSPSRAAAAAAASVTAANVITGTTTAFAPAGTSAAAVPAATGGSSASQWPVAARTHSQQQQENQLLLPALGTALCSLKHGSSANRQPRRSMSTTHHVLQAAAAEATAAATAVEGAAAADMEDDTQSLSHSDLWTAEMPIAISRTCTEAEPLLVELPVASDDPMQLFSSIVARLDSAAGSEQGASNSQQRLLHLLKGIDLGPAKQIDGESESNLTTAAALATSPLLLQQQYWQQQQASLLALPHWQAAVPALPTPAPSPATTLAATSAERLMAEHMFSPRKVAVGTVAQAAPLMSHLTQSPHTPIAAAAVDRVAAAAPSGGSAAAALSQRQSPIVQAKLQQLAQILTQSSGRQQQHQLQQWQKQHKQRQQQQPGGSSRISGNDSRRYSFSRWNRSFLPGSSLAQVGAVWKPTKNKQSQQATTAAAWSSGRRSPQGVANGHLAAASGQPGMPAGRHARATIPLMPGVTASVMQRVLSGQQQQPRQSSVTRWSTGVGLDWQADTASTAAVAEVQGSAKVARRDGRSMTAQGLQGNIGDTAAGNADGTSTQHGTECYTALGCTKSARHEVGEAKLHQTGSQESAVSMAFSDCCWPAEHGSSVVSSSMHSSTASNRSALHICSRTTGTSAWPPGLSGSWQQQQQTQGRGSRTSSYISGSTTIASTVNGNSVTSVASNVPSANWGSNLLWPVPEDSELLTSPTQFAADGVELLGEAAVIAPHHSAAPAPAAKLRTDRKQIEGVAGLLSGSVASPRSQQAMPGPAAAGGGGRGGKQQMPDAAAASDHAAACGSTMQQQQQQETLLQQPQWVVNGDSSAQGPAGMDLASVVSLLATTHRSSSTWSDASGAADATNQPPAPVELGQASLPMEHQQQQHGHYWEAPTADEGMRSSDDSVLHQQQHVLHQQQLLADLLASTSSLASLPLAGAIAASKSVTPLHHAADTRVQQQSPATQHGPGLCSCCGQTCHPIAAATAGDALLQPPQVHPLDWNQQIQGSPASMRQQQQLRTPLSSPASAAASSECLQAGTVYYTATPVISPVAAVTAAGGLGGSGQGVTANVVTPATVRVSGSSSPMLLTHNPLFEPIDTYASPTSIHSAAGGATGAGAVVADLTDNELLEALLLSERGAAKDGATLLQQISVSAAAAAGQHWQPSSRKCSQQLQHSEQYSNDPNPFAMVDGGAFATDDAAMAGGNGDESGIDVTYCPVIAGQLLDRLSRNLDLLQRQQQGQQAGQFVRDVLPSMGSAELFVTPSPSPPPSANRTGPRPRSTPSGSTNDGKQLADAAGGGGTALHSDPTPGLRLRSDDTAITGPLSSVPSSASHGTGYVTAADDITTVSAAASHQGSTASSAEDKEFVDASEWPDAAELLAHLLADVSSLNKLLRSHHGSMDAGVVEQFQQLLANETFVQLEQELQSLAAQQQQQQAGVTAGVEQQQASAAAGITAAAPTSSTSPASSVMWARPNCLSNLAGRHSDTVLPSNPAAAAAASTPSRITRSADLQTLLSGLKHRYGSNARPVSTIAATSSAAKGPGSAAPHSPAAAAAAEPVGAARYGTRGAESSEAAPIASSTAATAPSAPAGAATAASAAANSTVAHDVELAGIVTLCSGCLQASVSNSQGHHPALLLATPVSSPLSSPFAQQPLMLFASPLASPIAAVSPGGSQAGLLDHLLSTSTGQGELLRLSAAAAAAGATAEQQTTQQPDSVAAAPGQQVTQQSVAAPAGIAHEQTMESLRHTVGQQLQLQPLGLLALVTNSSQGQQQWQQAQNVAVMPQRQQLQKSQQQQRQHWDEQLQHASSVPHGAAPVLQVLTSPRVSQHGNAAAAAASGSSNSSSDPERSPTPTVTAAGQVLDNHHTPTPRSYEGNLFAGVQHDAAAAAAATAVALPGGSNSSEGLAAMSLRDLRELLGRVARVSLHRLQRQQQQQPVASGMAGTPIGPVHDAATVLASCAQQRLQQLKGQGEQGPASSGPSHTLTAASSLSISHAAAADSQLQSQQQRPQPLQLLPLQQIVKRTFSSESNPRPLSRLPCQLQRHHQQQQPQQEGALYQQQQGRLPNHAVSSQEVAAVIGQSGMAAAAATKSSDCEEPSTPAEAAAEPPCPVWSDSPQVPTAGKKVGGRTTPLHLRQHAADAALPAAAAAAKPVPAAANAPGGDEGTATDVVRSMMEAASMLPNGVLNASLANNNPVLVHLLPLLSAQQPAMAGAGSTVASAVGGTSSTIDTLNSLSLAQLTALLRAVRMPLIKSQ